MKHFIQSLILDLKIRKCTRLHKKWLKAQKKFDDLKSRQGEDNDLQRKNRQNREDIK